MAAMEDAEEVNSPAGASEEGNENTPQLIFKTITQENLKKERHESTC